MGSERNIDANAPYQRNAMDVSNEPLAATAFTGPLQGCSLGGCRLHRAIAEGRTLR